MEILLQPGQTDRSETAPEIMLNDNLAVQRDDLLLGFTDHEIRAENIAQNTQRYLGMLSNRDLGSDALSAAGASVLAAKKEHQAINDELFILAEQFSEALVAECKSELNGEVLEIGDAKYEYEDGYIVKITEDELPVVFGSCEKFIDRQGKEWRARGKKGGDISKAYVKVAQGQDWITLLENLKTS